jgi:predicted phage tail protein
VIGNEFEIDGRLYLSGIVRNAKDAQRMYNYWVSQEAEMLALAPKAPFIGYGGQFEGYEQQWKTANTTNWPYLEVNPDVTDGQGGPLPLPQRSLPPMAQTGLIQAKMGASDDIKATTGQYDSSLGQVSNERSGKAILARERQTDRGTYHYVDNYARAVRYITRQIVDLIPKIYDTARIARIIGEDGEVSTVKINPEQQMPVNKIVDQTGIVIEKIYNPGVGKYDVMVTTGPSYMTKRQEALEAMAQLLQGNPHLWAVAGDLFIKNMDWPGAQEMAKRFAKTIDPKLMEDGDKDPALQAAEQQMQGMAQEMEQMHTMLQNVSRSMEAQDLERKEFEAMIKAYDAETKRLSTVQASMSPDQIQDIVMGTVHSMITSGDLIAEMPQDRGGMGEEQMMPPPEQPMMPQEGMMPPPEQMQPPPMEQPT